MSARPGQQGVDRDKCQVFDGDLSRSHGWLSSVGLEVLRQHAQATRCKALIRFSRPSVCTCWYSSAKPDQRENVFQIIHPILPFIYSDGGPTTMPKRGAQAHRRLWSADLHAQSAHG